MFDLFNLEIHAWHGCNLACQSCSHFSSIGLRGGPSHQTCHDWMQVWASRLRPRTFSIVGGEPTLNRELSDIVRSAGSMWPDSRIRLVTNGLNLHHHPSLPTAMQEIKDRAYIEVSSHHSSDDFQKVFAPVRAVCADWRQRYGIDIRIVEAYKRWTVRYLPTETGVEFIHSDPREAWDACVAKQCRQLYDGLLWKCPTLAYINLLADVAPVQRASLEIAAQHVPLPPTCADSELDGFLSREHEEACGICPATLRQFELPNPIVSLSRIRGRAPRNG